MRILPESAPAIFAEIEAFYHEEEGQSLRRHLALFVTIIVLRLAASVLHKNWLFHRLCYRSGGEQLELDRVVTGFTEA